MKHGKYTGPEPELHGCGALLRPGRHSGVWLAQFDYMRTPSGGRIRPDETEVLAEVWACVGWHEFRRKGFKLDGPSRSQSHNRKSRPRISQVRITKGKARYASAMLPAEYTWTETRDPRVHGEHCNCIGCLPEPHSPASLIRRDQSGWMP